MRIYEFVDKSYDDMYNNNNTDDGGNGGGSGNIIDNTGTGGSSEYDSKFLKALNEWGKESADVIYPDGTIDMYLINYKYKTYDEWVKAGYPSITSLGDPSRNDEYYIEFTDLRAMNSLKYFHHENFSEDPKNSFVLDLVFELTSFKQMFVFFSVAGGYMAKNIKIHGDVLEDRADSCLRIFKKYGFTDLVKIKDYFGVD